MKKITAEEYAQLPKMGRGRKSAFFRSVSALQIGEILLLEKADWKKRYHPARTVKNVQKSTKRTFEVFTIITGQGWTVKRLT